VSGCGEYRGFVQAPITKQWKNVDPEPVPNQIESKRLNGFPNSTWPTKVEGVVIPAEPAPRERISGDDSANIIRVIREIGRNLGFVEVRIDRMEHPSGAWFEVRYVHGEVLAVLPQGFHPIRVWWKDDPYVQRVTTRLGDVVQLAREG